jgi:hypothetical protein
MILCFSSSVSQWSRGLSKELALPEVEEVGADLEFVTQSGDVNAFEQMALDDGGLLLGRKMAAQLLGH